MTIIPLWLEILVYLNPLTYGVDLIRDLLKGVSQVSIWVDIFVLLAFIGIMLALGTRLFNKSENLQ